MTDNGDKSRDAVAGSSTMGLLHNKVDKMIRLMVETSENQKKMNKVLQDLLKSGLNKSESVPVAAPEDKERDRDKDREGEREDRDGRKRKRRERERSREREESFGRDKRSKSPDPGLDSISTGPHQVRDFITFLTSDLLSITPRLTLSTRNSSGASTWL